MGKDTLQSTWLKSLGSVITNLAVDSSGNVWAGSISGKLFRVTSEGIISEPIQLDNPIYSVSVDESDCVYVGDAANNLYKYSPDGTLKWGKNLGEGNSPKVPLVSTINSVEPDENGNIDLNQTYYSKDTIETLIKDFGTTKSVNGNKPDDTGNITLDLSKYFIYKGVVDGESLDKAQATGWYSSPQKDGGNDTLLVYSDEKGIIRQVDIGFDNSVRLRSKKDKNFTDWVTITNNIKTVNGLRPDANGNVDLDLTGNIKTVNGIKPDKNGNIQLGVGSVNSIKSINTDNKPDETGNVTVPTFAPNLLANTSDKKVDIPVGNGTLSKNLWAGDDAASGTGIVRHGNTGEYLPQYGLQLISSVPVTSGESYTYNIGVMTVSNMIAFGFGDSHDFGYSIWRKPKFKINLVFFDILGNPLSGISKEYSLDKSDKPVIKYLSDSFTVPDKATFVQLWYAGKELTDDNLVIGPRGWSVAFDMITGAQDQLADVSTMKLSKSIAGKEVRIRLQAYVSNYKKGNLFTIKTKDIEDNLFKTDTSKLDSDKVLTKPIVGIDPEEIITGNGFYSWEYTVNGDDLVSSDGQSVTLISNVLGNINCTLKVVEITDSNPNPDMEWISAPTINSDGTKKYLNSACNSLNFYNAALYVNKLGNVIELGTYNTDNDYISKENTAGLYSASACVYQNNNTGLYRLVLQGQDTSGKILIEKSSDLKPYVYKDSDGKQVKDTSVFVTVDGFVNNKPNDVSAIKLYLYTYGQSDTMSYNHAKLAQWKDNGKTPPELTWLPGVNDILGNLHSVNGKLPDKLGNVSIDDFANPTKVFKDTKVNPDDLTSYGIYKLENVTLLKSPSDLPGFVKNTSVTGYIATLDTGTVSDNHTVYQLLMTYQVSSKGFLLLYRYIDVKGSVYPGFKRVLNTDDYNTLYKAIPSVDRPDRSYGTNELVDIDKLTETGIYHFMDAKVIASIKTDALDGVPKTTDGTTLCGYLFVMRHDDYNREQTLLLNGGPNDIVIATRSISGTNSWRGYFRRLLTVDDFNTLANRINGLNTIANPISLAKDTQLNTVTNTGLYWAQDGTTSDNIPTTIDSFDKNSPFYLFVPKQKPASSSNGLLQFIVQRHVKTYGSNIPNYMRVSIWVRALASDGSIQYSWFSNDNLTDSLYDLYNALYSSVNDIKSRFKRVNNEAEAKKLGLANDDDDTIYYW